MGDTRTMKTAFLVLLWLLLSGRAIAFPSYSAEWKEHYGHILRTKPEFQPGTPLESTIVSESPTKFAVATLRRTDGTLVTYDQETAHIEITSAHFPPVHVEVRFFRAIQTTWVTDRILLIWRDIGRTAMIEELLDVVDRKWLSQQSIMDEGEE